MSPPHNSIASRRVMPKGEEFFQPNIHRMVADMDGSGVYHKRGRRGYVMARRGDSGAYEVGNVEIVWFKDNFREAMDAYHFDRVY